MESMYWTCPTPKLWKQHKQVCYAFYHSKLHYEYLIASFWQVFYIFNEFSLTCAQLITYFGNCVFGFSLLRLRDFLYDVFHLQGKKAKTKWKINKLLRNTLVISSSPKTTKNEVTRQFVINNTQWKTIVHFHYWSRI